MFRSEYVQHRLKNIGPQILKLKVASEVLLPQIKTTSQKNYRPSTADNAPVVTETITPQTEAAPQEEIRHDIRTIYKSELRARIDQQKFYPIISRRLNQTGVVVVAFTLLEDGNIINIRIDKPSPFERLNAAGLEAVKKVERFKPIPKELGVSSMDITVPVKFYTI